MRRVRANHPYTMLLFRRSALAIAMSLKKKLNSLVPKQDSTECRRSLTVSGPEKDVNSV